MKICPHCKKMIPEKLQLKGIAFICPHCKKIINPFENEKNF